MRSLGGDLALAGAGLAPAEAKPPRVLLRNERAGRARGLWRLASHAPRGLGILLATTLILGAGVVGAVRGGQYRDFVAAYGSPGDLIARELGLGVKIVTIDGIARLDEREVLALAGVTPQSSLPFFDVDAARAGLLRAPLVETAGVRKLYPNRLVIDVTERGPVALWQRDGVVSIVSSDGAALDELKDARLNDLPFVVGVGANKHLKEYLALLDAAEELKDKIEAGVYVAERRWNLHMKTGVEVKLPQDDPASAVRELVKLERGSKILERSILALDLRAPGRAFARLTAEAADARAEKIAAQKPKKGDKP